MPKITIFFILLCKFKKYNTFYVKILFMMQDVVLAQNIAFCANFAEFCLLRKLFCAKLVVYDAEYCAKLVPLHAQNVAKIKTFAK